MNTANANSSPSSLSTGFRLCQPSLLRLAVSISMIPSYRVGKRNGYCMLKWPKKFLQFLIIPLCVLSSASLGSAADDLLDRYLSVPGSYAFVRRVPEDAKPDSVRLTVFEDFLCPACYQTVTQIIPQLQKKYGTRLTVQFLGYPFVHPTSAIPARAYVLAEEFGLRKEMQQALFRVQFEEQLDITSHDGLARVAHSIGLDPELLFARLDSKDGEDEVERILALGKSYQIDAVPGLILDGWIRANAISQTNLEMIIDGILEKKAGKK